MNENNFVPQQNQTNAQNQQTMQNQQQNQQNQQGQQFQQQFQQNINPQQYQQYQRPSKPITEIVVEFMPKLVLGLIILAGGILLYDIIIGIIKAASGSGYSIFSESSGGFGVFLNYLISGIESAVRYLFYAGVISGLYKVIKK